MPDPTGIITVGAGVAIVAKQAQDFIAAVSGHPGESIGTILGSLSKKRWENAEATAGKTGLILLNIGQNAQEIPMPVLLPALEGASLQEEPSMQEMWANLLANAADPRERLKVYPSFPVILQELTSHDAKFLDAIFQHAREQARNDPVQHRDPLAVPFTHEEFWRVYTGAGLCTPEQDKVLPADADYPSYRSGIREMNMSIDLLKRHGLLIAVPGFDRGFTYVSTLCECFLLACKPPADEDHLKDNG